MDVLARRFTSMCLTFLTVTLVCLSVFSSASSTLEKPTNLHITSVHDLTITLTWKRPAGIPITTNLLYIVRFVANGFNQVLPLQSEESAQITFRRNTKYNINVRAIRSDDHQVQSDWASLRVDTKDFVPAKPTNVRITRVVKFVASLAWNRPQATSTGIPDTSRLSYLFSYQKHGSLAKQLKISTNQFSLRLVPNTRYEFQVRAYKTFDPNVYGPWSDTLTYTSKEGVPSKPPTNVIAVSNTPSSIVVSWGPIPEDGRNGVIQGFVVFYCEQSTGHCSQSEVKLVYSTQIEGLVTGKQYKVRVAGYTKEGNGRKSPETTVVAGGPFITTTTQTPAQKPTTLKLTSTTKKTSTKSSTLAPTIALTQRPQRTSTGTPGTVPAPFDPTTSVSTKELHDTTGKRISEESTKGRRRATDSSVFQSTPVALASRDDEESPPGITKKLLTIAAPVVGVLILLIILGAVVVFSKKRSRRKRRQNGEIPVELVNLQRHERSRDGVTRGALSIRYAPPGDDSLTQGLLQPSEHNNDSLPRGMAEDGQLLGATGPQNCKLSVDLNTTKSELQESSAEGLYESIGSLKGAGCENIKTNDSGERYVTHDQMGVNHYKAPLVPASQTSPQQCNGAAARENPQGKFYENLPRSEHFYDTLSSEDQDGPVYENTRILPSLPVNKTDIDGEHEPLTM